MKRTQSTKLSTKKKARSGPIAAAGASPNAFLAPSEPTKAERTRRRILEAAIHIIANKGIERTTTREIAAEADVANGLVSHYVKKREDLFALVIQEIAKEAYLSIEAPPETASGLEKILWMADANLGFFFDRPDYAKCMVLFYYYATFVTPLRMMNQAMVERALSRLEAFWRQHLQEKGRDQAPTDIRLAVDVLHNQILSALIKYYTVPHSVAPRDFRLRFREELELLVRRLGAEK